MTFTAPQLFRSRDVLGCDVI